MIQKAIATVLTSILFISATSAVTTVPDSEPVTYETTSCNTVAVIESENPEQPLAPIKYEEVAHLIETEPVETAVVEETTCDNFTVENVPTAEPYYSTYNVTEQELEELAILVYLEAGAEPYECKVRVAEVIFNRLESRAFPNTLTEVIYQKNQFTPAKLIHCSTTTDEIREIVNNIYLNGSTLDRDILFFRAWYYHQWQGAVDEFYIGDTYFSSSAWCS